MSEIRNQQPAEILGELLSESLVAWGLDGTVERATDGSVVLSCKAAHIRVQSAAPGLPFRWMVSVDARTRGAISLIAVLRQVRAALDPDYAANRVRVIFSRA